MSPRPLAFLAVALGLLTPVEAAAPRSLTFDARVECQRRIEEVQWRHRLWPKENRAPKPALSAVLPDAAIRAKVEESQRMSALLETWWNEPIRPEQLQFEINRIVKNTKAPNALRDLFAALDNDPFMIAECLARPLLAQRRVEARFESDERIHGVQRRAVAKSLAGVHDAAGVARLAGEHGEFTLVRGSRTAAPGEFALTEDEWTAEVLRLAERFGIGARTAGEAIAALPLDRPSHVIDEDGHFAVYAVRLRTAASLTIVFTNWAKQRYDAWVETRPTADTGGTVEPTSYTFRLPSIATGCTDDTWSPMQSDAVPSMRTGHTAVWTGSEMIVWGGTPYGTGGRYDPATDSWVHSVLRTGGAAHQPQPLSFHSAVWTGTEMIVWGGTGGRYNPVTDSWIACSLVDGSGSNAPLNAINQRAVWTGSEMIVWGGNKVGGRYDPVTDTWAACSLTTGSGAGVPSTRSGFSAVWTGSVMVVWGGHDDGWSDLNSGSRYDPVSDSWTPTSLDRAPKPRMDHVAVWTGSEMIVWGGTLQYGAQGTGGRYDPVGDNWRTSALDDALAPNAPAPRSGHTAVWTGEELIVWGGRGDAGVLGNGGRYRPATDEWRPSTLLSDSSPNTPRARSGHTAVWTGTEMILWGGTANTTLDYGGRFVPAQDAFVASSLNRDPPIAPDARAGHTAVWTGAELIVWGGYGPNTMATGFRYDPATDTVRAGVLADSWAPNTPEPRCYHTAVWTGTEMVVWGGLGDRGVELANGGRFDPVREVWRPSSLRTGSGPDIPQARDRHSAVWTGSEMIVWGGQASWQTLATGGGRFDPATDAWIPMSSAGEPEPRYAHTAVWTGTELLVWGGTNLAGDLVFGNGGRYRPETDSWLPSALDDAGAANTPAARAWHTAVWTGREMIIWGGGASLEERADGGRYDPATDTWAACSLVDGSGAHVAKPRRLHTAVWTGSEMLVWGGQFAYAVLATGGRYDPATDTWAASSLENADGRFVPQRRYLHTAVWTGQEMIIWGGDTNGTGTLATGGRFDAASDSWLPTVLLGGARTNIPVSRVHHSSIWTGSELIVWGGYPYLSTGGRYDPALDAWLATSLIVGREPNVPQGRRDHTAVWTGTEMIVWGGNGFYFGSDRTLASGGRYSPATDRWSYSSLNDGTGDDVPQPMSGHTAVWTGAEMLVWGTSGGVYDPAGDRWIPTTLALADQPHAPARTSGHTANWTGREMLVWGGTSGGGDMGTGGCYDRAADAWRACGLESATDANAPTPRAAHTAVWTGVELIVWGGRHGSPLATGGRFDHATNRWRATSLTAGTGDNVPSARDLHSAVWTGNEMIVWGGSLLSDGGRYVPSLDRWTLSSLTTGTGANVSPPRLAHTGLWTAGTDPRMLLWGGHVMQEDTSSSGALYCAACPQRAWFRDADGDGFGNPLDSSIATCPAPAGYVDRDDDCNDANPAVHPYAAELTADGIDENCDGLETCFVDQDHDGHGIATLASSPSITCTAPGVAPVGDDCNDACATCFPGNAEVCDGLDSDCDGTVPASENDPDRDGVPTCRDNCPVDYNPDQSDIDHNGLGDVCDRDQDGDGVPREADNCPNVYNPDQADLDHDGTGDVCDPDLDGDGVPNATDNCPRIYNPSQFDADGDGVGGACDVNAVVTVSNDPAAGADFGSIQAAIDAATRSGTIVSIFPGAGPYHEPVRLARAQNFTLERREDGTGRATIIDGGSLPAIEVVDGAGSLPVRVRGLTLQGAVGVDTHVAVELTGVTISNVETGVRLGAGSLVLNDSTFTAPFTTGIVSQQGVPVSIARTRFLGATDAAIHASGTVTIDNSIIAAGKDGIVLDASSGAATVRYCTIARNGGRGIDARSLGFVTVERSIVAANVVADLDGVGCVNVSWSDVMTPDCSTSSGNTALEPRLDDAYRLLADAPCHDRGPDPAADAFVPPTDLAGELRRLDWNGDGIAQSDCGAFESRPAPFGPGEVVHLRFLGRDTLTWDALPTAVLYHLYRGRTNQLGPGFYGNCRDGDDANRTDLLATQTRLPPVAAAFFYLVTGEDADGREGTLGFASGAERSNYTPCP